MFLLMKQISSCPGVPYLRDASTLAMPKLSSTSWSCSQPPSPRVLPARGEGSQARHQDQAGGHGMMPPPLPLRSSFSSLALSATASAMARAASLLISQNDKFSS